jgi:hypothetical protein
MKTNHDMKIDMLATRIGRLICNATINPAMNGGIDIAKDCIDWFIPNISPWESLELKFDTIAELLGCVNPLETAMKGITKKR